MGVKEGQPHVDRAEQHAMEAERLLQGMFISSHVKAQVHATLALYYSTRSCNRIRSG